MKISILTLFPDMFVGPLTQSIIKRAQTKQAVEIEYINIRDFATDSYKTVDGHPYGGGVGMLLRVDIVDRALQKVRSNESKILLLDAGGTPYTQKKARELATVAHLILICGHYEGVDTRIRDLVDEELSIGDYVLTGGEIPAMVIADSVIRLLPGVLPDDATIHESFTTDSIEYPQYTQPIEYNGSRVPDVLVSGDHKKITAWRETEAKKRTASRTK